MRAGTTSGSTSSPGDWTCRSTVLDHFRDADAVADAWFARALRAMLREPEPGFDALPPSGRVHAVLMRWFDAQAAHRRVVGSMIGAKPHPSHPHHWVPMPITVLQCRQ